MHPMLITRTQHLRTHCTTLVETLRRSTEFLDHYRNKRPELRKSGPQLVCTWSCPVPSSLCKLRVHVALSHTFACIVLLRPHRRPFAACTRMRRLSLVQRRGMLADAGVLTSDAISIRRSEVGRVELHRAERRRVGTCTIAKAFSSCLLTRCFISAVGAEPAGAGFIFVLLFDVGDSLSRCLGAPWESAFIYLGSVTNIYRGR